VVTGRRWLVMNELPGATTPLRLLVVRERVSNLAPDSTAPRRLRPLSIAWLTVRPTRSVGLLVCPKLLLRRDPIAWICQRWAKMPAAPAATPDTAGQARLPCSSNVSPAPNRSVAPVWPATTTAPSQPNETPRTA